MGYVGYFYVESKSFDLRSGVGNGIVKLTEWGRGQMWVGCDGFSETCMVTKDDGRIGVWNFGEGIM